MTTRFRSFGRRRAKSEVNIPRRNDSNISVPDEVFKSTEALHQTTPPDVVNQTLQEGKKTHLRHVSSDEQFTRSPKPRRKVTQSTQPVIRAKRRNVSVVTRPKTEELLAASQVHYKSTGSLDKQEKDTRNGKSDIFRKFSKWLTISSSSSSSPTKSPDYSGKFPTTPTYQVTPNPAFAAIKDEHKDPSPPPPTLPPRNYRAVPSERPPKPQPRSTTPPSSSFVTDFTDQDFENTPKADAYADQLRQQMRKYSQSSSTINPARYQLAKPLPEMSTNISVSRPVDQQPSPQEAKAPETTPPSWQNDLHQQQRPIPAYRSGELSRDYISPPEQDSKHKSRSPRGNDKEFRYDYSSNTSDISSTHSTRSLHTKTEHSYAKSEHSSYLSPVESDTNSRLGNSQYSSPELAPSVLSQEGSTYKDDLAPQSDELRADPRRHLDLDDEDLDDSDTRYSHDSYMQYRSNIRQGFGGDYHREGVSPKSSPTSPFTPSPPASPGSVNPPKSETMVQVAAVTTHALGETKALVEPGPTRIPHHGEHIRTPPSAAERHTPHLNGIQTNGSAYHNVGLPKQSEEVQESPSVHSVIAKLNKRTDAPRPGGPESKSPVTRSKVFELKESLQRRSNENLLVTCSDSNESLKSRSPHRSMENVTNLRSPHRSMENVHKLSELRRESFEKDTRRQSLERVGSSEEDSIPPPLPTSSPPQLNSNGATPVHFPEVQEPQVISQPELEEEEEEVPETTSPRISHMRQKSHEEIECEKQAAIVALQLAEEDRQLTEVILPRPDQKKTTDYITGLFDTDVDLTRKPSLFPDDRKESPRRQESSLSPATSEVWLPPSITELQNRMKQESRDNLVQEMGGTSMPLPQQMEELVTRIERKIETLKCEKRELEEEIVHNKTFGCKVTAVVEKKCQSKQEFEKYKLYVDELDKVMYLLIKLSERLARAENAVLCLPSDAEEKTRAMLTGTRDNVSQKYEDAKQLKEGIDRRSQHVASFLVKYLTAEEYKDYEYFIKMKSKLTMDIKDIDDEIKKGEEQLQALRNSMNSSFS